MSALTPPNDTQLIQAAIQKAITYEVGEAFEENKKKLIERLDKEKDMIVSGVVLNLMKHVSMEYYGTDLRVTIRKIEEKS